MICRTDLDGVYPFKRGVEASLNYYLFPKLYVKLWLCPSVILIYMHSFLQSHLLYLSPWRNACCPGCVPDHHANGWCISTSYILKLSPYFLISIHAIRIVTAAFKTTESWFRSEILQSSSNSSQAFIKWSPLNRVKCYSLTPYGFSKTISDKSPSKHLR